MPAEKKAVRAPAPRLKGRRRLTSGPIHLGLPRLPRGGTYQTRRFGPPPGSSEKPDEGMDARQNKGRPGSTRYAQGCQEAGDDARCGRSSVAILTIAPCFAERSHYGTRTPNRLTTFTSGALTTSGSDPSRQRPSDDRRDVRALSATPDLTPVRPDSLTRCPARPAEGRLSFLTTTGGISE
jgi:hypothetical protein